LDSEVVGYGYEGADSVLEFFGVSVDEVLYGGGEATDELEVM